VAVWIPARAAPWQAGRLPDQVTIGQVLAEFLADQRARLSARTMRNYEDVISLFRDCMNGYGPNALGGGDYARWKKAFDGGDFEAYCHLLGPGYILGNVDEFLGYFMIRKVMAGQELLRAAGTVTKKLAAWLCENGYAGEDARDRAAEAGTAAARDLPRAEELAALLYRQSRAARFLGPPAQGRKVIEDQLMIERAEHGAIWFEGGIGPVRVSGQAAALATPGWRVSIVLAEQAGGWEIAEVGNVYP